MTRLTNAIRDRIVGKIMADVPKVDRYQAIEKMIVDRAVSLLPDVMQPIWNNPQTRAYVRTTTCHVGSDRWSTAVTIPSMNNCSVRIDTLFQGETALRETVEQLVDDHIASIANRKALHRQLAAQVATVQTFKQFADVFPQFVQYLPAKPDAVKNLPATTDVMNRLTAAGWPAGKGQAE